MINMFIEFEFPLKHEKYQKAKKKYNCLLHNSSRGHKISNKLNKKRKLKKKFKYIFWKRELTFNNLLECQYKIFLQNIYNLKAKEF